MVRKYPPDWAQAITLSLPENKSHSRITTLLGPGHPETTPFSNALHIVRTIALDVDDRGEVVDSRLLAFVSPDSLRPDHFASYVDQWGAGDYGDRLMLVSEHDMGTALGRARSIRRMRALRRYTSY